MTRTPRRCLLALLPCGLGACVGPQETLLIFLIVILLFGASRLPQLGRALGETLRAFRGASGTEDDEQARLTASRKATPIEHATTQPVDEARPAGSAPPEKPKDQRG